MSSIEIPSSLSFEKLKELVDHHFNVEKNPANMLKLLGLMVAVYGMAKTRQIQGLIAENGLLKDLPALKAIPVPNSAQPGQTSIYRHYKVPPPAEIPKLAAPELVSMYHSFMNAARLHPNNRCLGHRKLLSPATETTPAVYAGYSWLSYQELAERATAFGSGLKQLTGIQRQGFLGLYAQNSAQWILAETAANAYALVTIPLYDTLGAEAAQYIIRQTEMTTVVCSPGTFNRLLESAASCPSLKYLIVMDENEHEPLTPHMREEAARHHLSLFSMSEVESHGARAANRLPHDPPSSADIATLMYTSGTTGDPKGAILTHGNFMACHAALTTAIPNCIGATDVHISYLPLAHVFERVVLMTVLAEGGAVGFFRGNILWLLEDIALLQPTIFPSVPRLLNRIYDKVMSSIQHLSPLRQKLFQIGYETKKHYLYEKGASIHPFW